MLGTEPAATLAGACPVGNQKNKQNCVHDEPGQLQLTRSKLSCMKDCRTVVRATKIPVTTHRTPRGGGEAIHRAVCGSEDDYDRQESQRESVCRITRVASAVRHRRTAPIGTQGIPRLPAATAC